MATISQAFAAALEYHQAGQLDVAAGLYQQILDIEPSHADANHLLGVVAGQSGNHHRAVQCILRAIEVAPHQADFYVNLAQSYRALRNFPQAIACCRRALDLTPNDAMAWNNLGNALRDSGEPAEAIPYLRRAAQLDSGSAEIQHSLGNALRELGQLTEAIACLRRTIDAEPDHAVAYLNLGNAFKDQGDLDEALNCYQKATQLKPDDAAPHGNLLATLHYANDITAQRLAESHRDFERRHAAPLRSHWQPHDNNRDPDRRLRLGFVSPDFHRHPVAAFLIRTLENLDPEQFEIACYYNHFAYDDLTRRFQARSAVWRDVLDRRDDELAQQIRADRVDILFDLTGHTGGNRLMAFARKPAPIQITWIGYEGTTGMAAMDYLLADNYVVPPGSEMHYHESLLRLPDGYVCYDPPAAAPPVGKLPAIANGHITFGSFNNPAKVTGQVIDVWAAILRQSPGARLVLKYTGFGDQRVKYRIEKLFAAAGVEPHRLELLPFTSYADCLASYNRIDIGLDPFPFSGSATTCDALWMGVPVITCPGETFASRHSLTHLMNLGRPELVASNMKEYVAKAVALAGDIAQLTKLRGSLRAQMAASPLCDGRRLANNLGRLLREVWRHWVRQTTANDRNCDVNPHPAS